MFKSVAICINNELDFPGERGRSRLYFHACLFVPNLTEISLLTPGHDMESFLKPLVPFYPCFVLEHGMHTVSFSSTPCQLSKVSRKFM